LQLTAFGARDRGDFGALFLLKGTMLDSLVPLFVGFLLTTVIGGILGYYFQNRSWRHQNTAKVLETELQTALKVFDDISKLMDRRLYRMRLLFWRLSDHDADQEALEKSMSLFRDAARIVIPTS
jgi:hypothetical protein